MTLLTILIPSIVVLIKTTAKSKSDKITPTPASLDFKCPLAELENEKRKTRDMVE